MNRSQTLRALDLFCGAGGSSWGARRAGFKVICGVDLAPSATKAYKRNFPDARVICKPLQKLDPAALTRSIGKVDLLLASPECTNHSPAKGSAPRCEASRRTALQVVRFADTFNPRWIVIENVVNMRRWARYDELLADLEALSYHVKPIVLNAADFGVPQTRRRLFIVCDREGPPVLPRRRRRKRKGARSVVYLGDEFAWRPLFGAGRARDTITRARRALRTIGRTKPFLLVYYGSDGAGGWQRLDRPLRTITTLDRFAIVKPTADGHMMRMLQVPELKRAMGMPRTFVAGLGSRREQIHAIGNAVCPPVMCGLIHSLVRGF